jgi:hypothetical protein
MPDEWVRDAAERRWIFFPASHGHPCEQRDFEFALADRHVNLLIAVMAEGNYLTPNINVSGIERIREPDLKITHRLLDIIMARWGPKQGR